jgi:hypothetical protein
LAPSAPLSLVPSVSSWPKRLKPFSTPFLRLTDNDTLHRRRTRFSFLGWLLLIQRTRKQVDNGHASHHSAFEATRTDDFPLFFMPNPSWEMETSPIVT